MRSDIRAPAPPQSGAKIMQILKASMTVETRTAIVSFDAIEHLGRIWIVPNWFEYRDKGYKSPERIVSISNLPHQKEPPDSQWGDFYIHVAIPTSVFLVAR